ncbi:riboflavine-aldehyde-forming enzyme [Infundibulicybe gibba]|nr:riboflavine-aldehyde-forming enzyme [Infundibulicybe gibba]
MKFIVAALSSLALIGSVSAFRGEATFFAPGLGACGQRNTGNDLIVALNSAQYGNGGNCNKNISQLCVLPLFVVISRANDVGVNPDKGKSVTVKVVDKCPGCGINGIDLSPAAFDRLEKRSVGRIQVDWNFV